MSRDSSLIVTSFYLNLTCRFQIPLPSLMAQSYVPGPASAGGAAAAPAAPKYRAIAVEFDDLHNQERVILMLHSCSHCCTARFCDIFPLLPVPLRITANTAPLNPSPSSVALCSPTLSS